MNNYESFRNPEKMYYGTDFWMLNDRLEEDEIVRQLHEMKKQGVYSFIARTYIGLKSDYPGEDFKSKLKLIVKTAKELDMKVFLQAGYMPEHVLDLPKEYSLNYIKVYRNTEPDSNETVLCRFGDVIFTEYNSGTFLDMFNHDSVAFYLEQSYGKMWTDFEEEYGKTIMSIWVDEPSYAAEYFPYPDGIEAKFKERWGYSLKDNIYKLYYDEEGYRTVRYHYRKLLQDMLEENYFKMLRAWCSEHGLLASGHLMLEDTLEVQITRACAAMPYYKYFDIPGIDLLCGQMNWRSGEIKSEFKYVYRPTITTTPIQCASAARQLGSDHILCEMYGVTSQNMTFRNQKHQFDYMAAHGINHRSVHGIFYSLHGRAKRMYPPHVNYYQPYWDELHKLYDYVASASRFISLGKPDEDVLVIHPLDSAYCEFVSVHADKDYASKLKSYRNLKVRDTYFHNLIVSLSLAHCVFDLGDERTIEDMGKVDGRNFVVGKMRYNTVVLPDMLEIQKSTLEKLREFAKNGGRIIVTGNKPTLLDGYEVDRDLFADIPGVICTEDVNTLIPLIENKEYALDAHYYDKNIFIRRRTDGNDGYYFVFNADCSSKKNAVLTVKGNVKAELWDGFTKEKTELLCRYLDGATQIDLCIPEGGSLMVHTEKTENIAACCRKSLCGKTVYELDDNWTLERKNPNVLLLEFCSFKKADGDYSAEYPVLAVQQMLVDEDYHGEITQKYTFTTDVPLTGLKLALEDAAQHKIYFNGKEVSSEPSGCYFSRSFETVPLPDAIYGENVIELKREFVPLEKMKSSLGSLFEERKGVELEFAYLLGDFAVKATEEPERNGDLRYSRKMSLTTEKKNVFGELTKAGYPFYAGTVALTKEFTIDAKGRAYITLDELDGCIVKVVLNGKVCGYMHCPPYRTEITEALTDGKNVLTLELTNTLRNLLGPYHRPDGEIGRIGGGYGFPDYSWIGVFGADDKTWYDNRVPDTKRWTDSYMAVALGVQNVKIEVE